MHKEFFYTNRTGLAAARRSAIGRVSQTVRSVCRAVAVLQKSSTYISKYPVVQLRSDQVAGVGREDAVRLHLLVQVLGHLVRHVRVGVQLVAHHVRRCHPVLKTAHTNKFSRLTDLCVNTPTKKVLVIFGSSF